MKIKNKKNYNKQLLQISNQQNLLHFVITVYFLNLVVEKGIILIQSKNVFNAENILLKNPHFQQLKMMKNRMKKWKK